MSTTHFLTIAWVVGWTIAMIALGIWAVLDDLREQ